MWRPATQASPLVGSMIEVKQPHGGGLAGAVGPHQAEDLPLGHGERQLVHRGQIAEPLRQLIGFDGVHAAILAEVLQISPLSPWERAGVRA